MFGEEFESRAVDPDLAFQVYPDPDPIRIQGFDYQKLKKENAAEKCLWIIFVLLDPDLDCESGSGFGSRAPLNPDPDPKHCLKRREIVVYLESRAFIHTCGFLCINNFAYLLVFRICGDEERTVTNFFV
jgi:hypothetical protein